jgi:3-hydroxyacyl-CoA dehydrogenase
MNIRKVAVIGSGTMGAAVAAHLANAGLPVLLLDVVNPAVPDKNAVARAGLAKMRQAKPAALMHPSRAALISVGNIDDDLGKLRDVDWVFEAIVERLDIKQQLWAKVEAVVGPHTIISSNSSGIPMHLQVAGRSPDFVRRFVGAHFFNPPRYLKLLELIPTPQTDPAVLATLQAFGDEVLGKGVVVAKDVPGFIANRIGVYGMIHTMRAALALDLSPDVVDVLTGPLIGRASSASFRTNDLSGLDIGLAVAKNLDANTEYDYAPPPLLERLVELGRLGEKTGEGFFKRVKHDGQSVILTLNYHTLEYEQRGKVRLPAIDGIRTLPTPLARIKALLQLEDSIGQFIRRNIAGLIWFAASNIPTCADDVYAIDNALKWGFAWELGPFELCDGLGMERVLALLASEGLDIPPLLAQHRETGERFYTTTTTVPTGILQLAHHKHDAARVVKTNPGASLIDVGDGVVVLEFHSKANALGEDAVRMVQYAMKAVPEQFVGLVVGNQGEHFSAGANLATLLMNAQDGEWEDIDVGIRMFQKMTTSLRFAPFPTVVAPFGLALGGGCELALYADHIEAHSELYMGLVEVGVGLIPAGGGTTEVLCRYSDGLSAGDDPFGAVQRGFELIALAKTSTSALEARDWGLLRANDGITMNRDRLLAEAKRRLLGLVPHYVAPQPRQDIPVLGEAAFAKLKYAIYSLRQAQRISDHDAVIATHLARVLSGGTLNHATRVSTQYLLDLEREAFLKLCGQRKTQERIAHTLKTGKPLRN